MPIYLVRWPDLSASLVRARDEDHLIHTLDQVANPDGCEWSVYQGPLFIDFRLPAAWHIEDERPGAPVTPEQVVVGDVGRMASEPIVDAVELSLAGEDGHDAGMAILRTAFPPSTRPSRRSTRATRRPRERGWFRSPRSRRRCTPSWCDACDGPGDTRSS